MSAAGQGTGRRTGRRALRLALLLGPGFVLVVLPFLASLAALGAYSLGAGDRAAPGLGFDLWIRFLSDPFSWRVLGKSVAIAAMATFVTLALAYPVAAALLQLRSRAYTAFATVALFSPLLMSVVSRSYGWLLLLSDHGLLNTAFAVFGLGPYRLVFNEFGVVVAIVHVILPYAVLPILNTMSQIPPLYREAALDLGASGGTVFRRISLPLALPGIVVAAEIVFALSVSSFVTPSLLGGGRVLTLSRLIYDNIGTIEWGLAAVQAIALLATALAVLFVLERVNRSTYGAGAR